MPYYPPSPFPQLGVQLLENPAHWKGQFEMSIMPEGGWGDPPQQDAQQKPDYPKQPTCTPRSSYLTCKVCDRGTLSSKTVFRMGGPVVAIGFILLIPSILGMLFSAFMFLGVNARSGGESGTNASESSRPSQSASDASFRQNCAKSTRRTSLATGGSGSMAWIEPYCECALATFRETGSEVISAQICTQRAREGTLDSPSVEMDALYTDDTPHTGQASSGTNPVRVFGSLSAVTLGIIFFVGGLLGWLLVMRKRVLQCNVCGAVVNAS